jgi:transposase InsO family protein
MELWQMDVMGGVRLVDGSEVKVVTGIDDHSRFCVSAMVVPRATAKPVCDALAAAMRRHGVPDQILTDNGKVFTGRFGPGPGEVLFDRICRENGIDHLLTAPRSPTTTGKVERFHKTIRTEFLTGRVFSTIEEAQTELDGWVTDYNTTRPHQGIGMVPPVRRFELAVATPVVPVEPSPPVIDADDTVPAVQPRATRRVGSGGRISVAGHKYYVGRWLAGEVVEVVSRNGLIEISHRGVLVANHPRLHRDDQEPGQWQRRARKPRPATVGRPVIRKVDGTGSVSFAGVTYRAGNAYRRRQVEVRVVGATVQISADGKLIRTHPVKHHRDREHGAFAVAGGRPRRSNAAT